jgi:UDP-N-acetylglucosamine--N-acetylmuramyl-(pentapeptide) pyrophosphoryl-undecaprenol N-acetylglucosamine transferase
MKKILLVGGGTAGHIDPALAVGDWFRENKREYSIEFLGTKNGLEKELVNRAGFKLHFINKVQAPRKLDISAILFPFKFAIAFGKSLILISKFEGVIGFGGYVSAPAYLASKLLGKKLLIHEANAKPGWANRFGKRFADQTLLAFPVESPGWEKAKVTGMPLSRKFINNVELPAEAKLKIRNDFLTEISLEIDKKVILVFGGSLGANKINENLISIKNELMKLGYQIVLSSGKNSTIESQPGFYATPYLYEMERTYLAADYVVARSGAVTCAQLEELGLPALLIPLSIGNGEQAANAKILAASGQAKILNNNELTPETLLKNLEELMNSAKARQPMGRSIHHNGVEHLVQSYLAIVK